MNFRGLLEVVFTIALCVFAIARAIDYGFYVHDHWQNGVKYESTATDEEVEQTDAQVHGSKGRVGESRN